MNKWSGIWRTRNGKMVEIAEKPFSHEIILGKIVDGGIMSVWNYTNGNHLEDSNLDLMIKKRPEEPMG